MLCQWLLYLTKYLVYYNNNRKNIIIEVKIVTATILNTLDNLFANGLKIGNYFLLLTYHN